MKKPLKITAEMAVRAKHANVVHPDDAVRPYSIPKPMPGVVPAGASIIAQDSAIDALYSGYVGQNLINEGLQFMGYPYLAQLTQRPEYRRISEIMAKEMTRKWIKLHSTGDEDKSEKLKALDDELKRFGVQDLMRRMAELDGFFGKGQLFIDTGHASDDAELATQLIITKHKITEGYIKRLAVVEPFWTYPGAYNAQDPLRKDFYRPTHWYVQGRLIHTSRLLTFVSREMPDMLKPAYSFGGLSLSQMAKPYVDNWIRTRQSVSDTVHAFSVSVLSTDMASTLAGDTTGADLFARVDLFNRIRDNRGVMLLNKDTEEFGNVSAPLSTLDKLQAQAQEQMSSVTGIPLVILLGITPSGLNASTDGEIQVFYNWIQSQQEHLFRNALTTIIQILQLNKFGEIDFEIDFSFEPLQEMSEKDKADIRKTNTDTASALITAGIISPEEERQRLADEEGGLYNGLDPNDLPQPPQQAEPGMDPNDPNAQDPNDPNAQDPNAQDPELLPKENPIIAKDLAMDDAAGWAEHKHPRDSTGKFTSGGGTSASATSMKNALHPSNFASQVTKDFMSKIHAKVDTALSHEEDDSKLSLLEKIKAGTHEKYGKVHKYLDHVMKEVKENKDSDKSIDPGDEPEDVDGQGDPEYDDGSGEPVIRKQTTGSSGGEEEGTDHYAAAHEKMNDLWGGEIAPSAQSLMDKIEDGTADPAKIDSYPDPATKKILKDFHEAKNGEAAAANPAPGAGSQSSSADPSEDLIDNVQSKLTSHFGSAKKVPSNVDSMIDKIGNGDAVSEDIKAQNFDPAVEKILQDHLAAVHSAYPALELTADTVSKLKKNYASGIPDFVNQDLEAINSEQMTAAQIDANKHISDKVKGILKDHLASMGASAAPAATASVDHKAETLKSIEASFGPNLLPKAENYLTKIDHGLDIFKIDPKDHGLSPLLMKDLKDYQTKTKGATAAAPAAEAPAAAAPAAAAPAASTKAPHDIDPPEVKTAAEQAHAIVTTAGSYGKMMVDQTTAAWDAFKQNGDYTKVSNMYVSSATDHLSAEEKAINDYKKAVKDAAMATMPKYEVPSHLKQKLAEVKALASQGASSKAKSEILSKSTTALDAVAKNDHKSVSYLSTISHPNPTKLQAQHDEVVKAISQHANDFIKNPHKVTQGTVTPTAAPPKPKTFTPSAHVKSLEQTINDHLPNTLAGNKPAAEGKMKEITDAGNDVEKLSKIEPIASPTGMMHNSINDYLTKLKADAGIITHQQSAQASVSSPSPAGPGPSAATQAAAAKKIAVLPHKRVEQTTYLEDSKGAEVKAVLKASTKDIPGDWYAKITAAYGGNHTHGTHGAVTDAVNKVMVDYSKAESYKHFTPSEVKAVQNYQNGLYDSINVALNTGNISPSTKASIETLKSAVAKSVVPADTPVYRGLKCDLKQLTGFSDPADAIGRVFEHKNFASVSRSKNKSAEFSHGKTLMKFTLPAGSKGVVVTKQDWEKEIILGTNGMFRIDKVEEHAEGHQRVIHCTYLGHRE